MCATAFEVDRRILIDPPLGQSMRLQAGVRDARILGPATCWALFLRASDPCASPAGCRYCVHIVSAPDVC